LNLIFPEAAHESGGALLAPGCEEVSDFFFEKLEELLSVDLAPLFQILLQTTHLSLVCKNILVSHDGASIHCVLRGLNHCLLHF
jgi:hypothetical protein